MTRYSCLPFICLPFIVCLPLIVRAGEHAVRRQWRNRSPA
jgi:hypothetical protein